MSPRRLDGAMALYLYARAQRCARRRVMTVEMTSDPGLHKCLDRLLFWAVALWFLFLFLFLIWM